MRVGKRIVEIVIMLFCTAAINALALTPTIKVNTQQVNEGYTLLDQTMKPTKALQTILEKENIKATNYEKLVQQTQQKWLRKPGTERWHLDQTVKPECNKLFESLGLVEACNPRYKHYDYVLVLGAVTKTMQLRLNYLIDQYRRGVKFKEVYFLVGERPLATDNKDDFIPNMPTTLKTEADAADYLVKSLKQTKIFKDIPIHVVRSHMNGMVRPNTADTVRDFLLTKPHQDSKILAVSNQPYIGYQNAAVKIVLGANYELETVGPGIQNEQPYALYLDTLARWIYQLDRLRKIV